MKSTIVGILATAGLIVAGSGMATDMPLLAKKNACVACHAIDKKLVGPAWMDVSMKYKSATKYTYKDKEYPLEEGLIIKVSKGGSGNWGSMTMPANAPAVKDADIRELVRFILSLANPGGVTATVASSPAADEAAAAKEAAARKAAADEAAARKAAAKEAAAREAAAREAAAREEATARKAAAKEVAAREAAKEAAAREEATARKAAAKEAAAREAAAKPAVVATPAAVAAAKPGAGSTDAFPADMRALAAKSKCLACHAIDKKLVGPAWTAVAKKYKGDAGAEARLVAAVSEGGSGNWGNMRMPPSAPAVKADDIRTLVKFILSLDK